MFGEHTKEDLILGDLLAVIHRDGGHYQNDHGTEGAAEDAKRLWYERAQQIDDLKARLEQFLSIAAENERLKQDSTGYLMSEEFVPIERVRLQLAQARANAFEEIRDRVVHLLRNPHDKIAKEEFFHGGEDLLSTLIANERTKAFEECAKIAREWDNGGQLINWTAFDVPEAIGEAIEAAAQAEPTPAKAESITRNATFPGCLCENCREARERA